MGKVLAICAVVVIIAIIISAVSIWFQRQSLRSQIIRQGGPIRGDLSRTQERQLTAHLDSAHRLMLRLVQPLGSLDAIDVDSTILSSDHRKQVTEWIDNYTNLRRELP